MPYANPADRAAWSRRYYAANKERVLATKRAWVERNSEKRAAHLAVGAAIKSGRLTKGSCEECGSTNVHAHHDDYSLALDVRWLCPAHHKQLHAREGVNHGTRSTRDDRRNRRHQVVQQVG